MLSCRLESSNHPVIQSFDHSPRSHSQSISLWILSVQSQNSRSYLGNVNLQFKPYETVINLELVLQPWHSMKMQKSLIGWYSRNASFLRLCQFAHRTPLMNRQKIKKTRTGWKRKNSIWTDLRAVTDGVQRVTIVTLNCRNVTASESSAHCTEVHSSRGKRNKTLFFPIAKSANPWYVQYKNHGYREKI